MLTIRDLHVSYGRHAPEVLRGVDLTLRDGEIGILLGCNGAGKSTLFSSVLGLLKPQAGELLFDGEPLSRMTRRARAERIGYVPQSITFGSLTVFDSVLMGRISRFGLRAGKDDEAVVRGVLEEMGLSHLASRAADELSGGEKQKAAIARAIAQEPRLIVFDEPTGNLDMANERLLVSEVRRLSRERGMSVLMSVHDLNTALELGDRLFFLKDGVIHCEGGPEVVTEELIRDVYGVRVRILEFEDKRIIIGGTKT